MYDYNQLAHHFFKSVKLKGEILTLANNTGKWQQDITRKDLPLDGVWIGQN